MADSILEGLA
jgi:hypothetical protein